MPGEIERKKYLLQRKRDYDNFPRWQKNGDRKRDNNTIGRDHWRSKQDPLPYLDLRFSLPVGQREETCSIDFYRGKNFARRNVPRSPRLIAFFLLHCSLVVESWAQ